MLHIVIIYVCTVTLKKAYLYGVPFVSKLTSACAPHCAYGRGAYGRGEQQANMDTERINLSLGLVATGELVSINYMSNSSAANSVATGELV